MALTPVMMVDNGRIVGGGSGSDEYTEISYSDWLELTPEQQETGKWDVKGVPGADGTISIDLMTKLWENPSPRVAFAAQNITLSSDDYDLLLIVYIWTISSPEELSIIVEKANGAVLSVGLPSSYGSRNMSRYCSFTSDTVINFTDGRDSIGASASTINNERCIPVAIYGIKLHHTVEIKTIAPEVSTLASKCMMSDGETSVEEALDKVDKIRIVLSGEITASTIKEFFLTLMQTINALNLGWGECCFVKCTWSNNWYCCGYVCKTSSNYITFNITPYSGSYLYCGNYTISNNSVIVYRYAGTAL